MTLVDDVVHNEAVVRQAAAGALATAVANHAENVATVLEALMEVYEEKLYVRKSFSKVVKLLGINIQYYSPNMRPSNIKSLYSPVI